MTEDDDELRAVAVEWQKRFDGLLAELPAWLPEDTVRRFKSARRAILSHVPQADEPPRLKPPRGETLEEKEARYTAERAAMLKEREARFAAHVEQVKRWLDEYPRIGEEGGPTSLFHIPRQWWDVLRELAEIRYAISLGREAGLAFLLGDDEAKHLLLGIHGQEKRIEGGKTTAAARRQASNKLREQVRAAWLKMDIEEHLRAGKLAQRFDLSQSTIRRHCQDLRKTRTR